MTEATRREFLAGIAAGLSALGPGEKLSGKLSRRREEFPPHRPLSLIGVHAYPSDHSVAAGSTLALHVSSSVPYRLSICRLGPKPDDPEGDAVVHGFPDQEPKPFPIHPGSYVHVEKKLKGRLTALTLECWVRPWKIVSPAGLLTQFDRPNACALGLFVRPAGELGFYLCDGAAFRPDAEHVGPKDALKTGRWHHVAGTWDGAVKTLWVDGRKVASWAFRGPVEPGPAPLRIGAAGNDGVADLFADVDLAMPALYDRALSDAEIEARSRDQARTVPKGEGVLACWPLEEERGERTADASGNGRDGILVNHATWMIGGPAFNADVPRFGAYDPARDRDRGHGLRLASDDLYDCRWPVRHEWRVPEDARPGLYVARFRFELEGKPRLYDATFIVRRSPRRPRAAVLVLAAANTWRAYSGTPFAVTPPALKQVWGTGGIANAPGNPPAYNLYRAHAAGQGTYQVGLRMPWPAAGPYVLYGGPTDYSHLMRADRFLHAWLDGAAVPFDVVSDLDLHRDPELLKDRRVFVINGHNEYWSVPMYRALEAYLKGGGNVVVLSGNTLFWRVSFNEDHSVMECRKVDAPGNQVPAARRGEAWHSQDGRRGGLARECGIPGWKLIGLDTLGWNNQGNPENFGPFVVEEPDHFLFNEPEKLGLARGDRIGHAGEGKVPMANGHEFDVRLSTLSALQEQPAPPGAAVPPDPPGLRRIANGIIPWKKGGSAFDYFLRKVSPKTDQGGEMIYWERPEGGRVFNAGTIGFGWALLSDGKLQGLLRNVLAHFGAGR